MSAVELAGRFLRFGLVGGSGVLVDMGALYLLHDPKRLALPLVTAKLISAQLAIFNNFTWNEIWTFADRAALKPGAGARLARFARFEVICLAGVAITVAVLTFCVRQLGLHYLIGNAIAIGVGTAWNFAINLRWNWAAPRASGA
ncbi:MAG TPA: GtrA family protein [Candidatus Sulfotelmatobacter sp.]|nr:GtrA family protein [Candidatus Sulfotelmatobacter sp.]